MPKRLAIATTLGTLLAAGGVAPSLARGQLPAAPPTALPTHSALPGDQLDRATLSVRPPEFTAAIPPPSNEGPDFVPLPPLAKPQPAGPTFGEEPPPSPWFSLHPSYIPPGAKSGSFQQSLLRATYLPRMGA